MPENKVSTKSTEIKSNECQVIQFPVVSTPVYEPDTSITFITREEKNILQNEDTEKIINYLTPICKDVYKLIRDKEATQDNINDFIKGFMECSFIELKLEGTYPQNFQEYTEVVEIVYMNNIGTAKEHSIAYYLGFVYYAVYVDDGV